MIPVVCICCSLALLLATGDESLDSVATIDEQYTVEREFVSPVSGEVFFAQVLRDELVAVTWDYDRCPHPPINTLAYTLVIDPVSGYVARPDEFPTTLEWSLEDLQAILGEPRFARDTPPGLPWAGAYPWERYENAALLATALGQPSQVIGNFWLLAGWSVRLDVVSGHNEFDTYVEELLAPLPMRVPEIPDLLQLYEMQLAEYWQQLHDTSQLLDVTEPDFCLAMAWLFRSRGELLATEHWLRSASLSEPGLAETNEFYAYLTSSIELERHYLRNARKWFIQAWNDGGFSFQQEADAAFLLGETNRRLGDLGAAVYWYDVTRDKNLGMLSNDLIQRQRDLSEGSRGY
jgi:hypothetical protein